MRIAPDGTVAPAFDRRMLLPTGSGNLEDLDYAGGRLYLSGFMGNAPSNPVAMVVADRRGVRLDVVAGQAYDLAVGSDRVYLAGLRLEGATQAALGDGIGSFRSVRVTSGEDRTSGGVLCAGGVAGTGSGGSVTVLGSSGCAVQFHNRTSPWPADSCVATAAYHAGRQIADPRPVAGGGYSVRVDRLTSGSVHVEWECLLAGGATETRVEFKGDIVLIDPSGAVVDGRSGRPVRGAEARLETAPARGARFGRPSLSGISPQVNPQITDSRGRFGWDVAPGLWRLRIRAFGYRPYTSPVYVIPPEVTGLSPRLRPHPAQQARLIDPVAGRVGAVRLGGPPRRAAGLRLRTRGPRVRRIVVTGSRFRTVSGVRVGSREAAVQEAYPLPLRRLRAALRGSVHRYPVGRATIEVRRGRVSRIVLGR